MNPIPFTNTYARLPEAFFAPQAPAIPASPTLIKLNISLAEELNLNLPAIHALGPAQIFSGATIPPGAEPIALAYAGHQFGHFVPQLGDGRAILLGEVIDTHGNRRDIQLKGSGRTPFSRGGDGRAALGPVLREYLVSEAMHALGIPTTRALAAVSTGEFVARERPLPGAVITRVAASHIRVGTFQFFAARGDTDALRQLTSHAIARHYPDAKTPLEFLKHVINAQAELIAKWMGVGFIHGVMNTDNMAISGETIDFGPCAFMDAYDPATVFSAIDEQGRYAYARQPRIAQWNLARLAETLVPLIDSDTDKAIELATEAINGFGEAFDAAWLSVMRAKLGLHTAEAGDSALAGALLQLMHRQQTDFTQTFRTLPEGAAHLFANPQEFTAWQSDWHARLSHEARTPEDAAPSMRAVNPAFIPRNHRVEQALTAAIENADFAPFEELLSVLMRPYDDQAEFSRYATPALPEERVLRTFCGT